jgi:hypothetical protein
MCEGYLDLSPYKGTFPWGKKIMVQICQIRIPEREIEKKIFPPSSYPLSEIRLP